MPQIINTNVASLNAQRNLDRSQNDANVAFQRLSSGLRINSAKDDAAGLAISTRFESQITGLNMAQRNANDGISLAQTAEGALNEVVSNLQRIRELSVQAANGTNSATDLDALNNEVQARIDEIQRISEQTSFNGVDVLTGLADPLSFQVGANPGDTIEITLTQGTGKEVIGLIGAETGGAGQGLDAIDITAVGGPDDAMNRVDAALDTINGIRSELGAVQNRFESTIANLSTTSENLSAANSRIRDADFAKETAEMSRTQVLQQAGLSVLSQANASPQQVLNLLQG